MTIRETLTNILRLPSDARAVVEMARENAEKQKETYALESVLLRKVESLERQLDDARNEVGPQLALIEELRRQLRVGTERIRELETQAEAEVARLTKALESVHESYRGVVQRRQWKEVGDERWHELLAVNARVLLSGGDYPCCAAFVGWCNDDRTHYCEIAAP